MNTEIGQHPGLFLFLNRLNTAVFEQGMNVVAQANAGKQVVKVGGHTQAARKLAEKAAKAEEDYAAGHISATELVRRVASHYDDEKVLDVLASMSTPEELDSQGEKKPLSHSVSWFFASPTCDWLHRTNYES